MTPEQSRADELKQCIAIVDEAKKLTQSYDWQGCVSHILERLKARRAKK